MPMWCPPTPPQQDTDVYIDPIMSFLYDTNTVMSESQLPPIYVRKDLKRTRQEAGLSPTEAGRRALKIPCNEEHHAPRSLFHSAAVMKVRRDMKLQKYRGMMKSGGAQGQAMAAAAASAAGKPGFIKVPGGIGGGGAEALPPALEWTVHEDMALLKVVQMFQGLPLNLITSSPGHSPNWDFVSDYVNAVSVTYRPPKQCRHRYESVLIQREEGKQVFEQLKKKKKANNNGGGGGGASVVQRFHPYPKSSRPMRTSQLFTQDNNSTFSKVTSHRFDGLKAVSSKRVPMPRTISNNPLLVKNPKHTEHLASHGIDVDHPVMPVEVAVRKAERIAKEKKTMTPEQQQHLARFHMLKTGLLPVVSQSAASGVQAIVTAAASSASTSCTQAGVSQSLNIVPSNAIAVSGTPGTPPSGVRQQRIISSSPLQGGGGGPTVVSVSGLSPAQIQAAQRLIVQSANAPLQAKGGGEQGVAGVGGGGGTAATAAVIQTKSINPAQLQLIRQQANFKQQQLRLQAANLAAGQTVKTTPTSVTIGGQAAVVQLTQPRAQFLRQNTASVGGGGGKATGITTRTVTESEVTQLLKKQQQQQQQKTMAAAVQQQQQQQQQQTQASTIQGLQSQVFAQTMQQAGTSAAQVTTLLKAVSNAGVNQTVSIPVSTLNTVTQKVAGQVGSPGTTVMKSALPQQLRHLQLQNQYHLAQQKRAAAAAGQKINLAQASGKGGGGGNVQAQVIMGSGQKPVSTPMTVQQFTQVIRNPPMRGVPVVLAKGGGGTPRVIPLNTPPGTKQQTIQVVTSQAMGSALRPQGSTTLTGIKVQGQANATAAQQAALLSQVSAALQNQSVSVRQGSPVRLQSGASIVALTVQQSSANVQQQHQQQQTQSGQSQSSSSSQQTPTTPDQG